MDHGAGNLVPILIWGLFIIVAIRRGMKRIRRAPVAAAPAFAKTAAPPPRPPEAPLAQRRFKQAPALPPPRPAPAAVPAIALPLPPEAAAAFAELDLSLPGTPGSPGPTAPAPARRRIRSLGGGPAFGSRQWALNGIVANEILGPPVSLRPGATLGAPHAF